MREYDPGFIEPKWEEWWEKHKVFKVPLPQEFDGKTADYLRWLSKKPKYYVLDMFPYPSGAGLHVGHPKWYTANDIVARYKNAKWYRVLHPMGRDAFGLPAENYAIKTWTHPKVTTQKNIETFKKQIQRLGFSYDRDREIDTTDPAYYRWTQWIFLKMWERSLAYEQNKPINYCPKCKTGLANEEVLKDGTCERCWTKVVKKPIRQWMLAITKYADRLASDVDKLDWPEGIKEMQRNWIWKSEGTQFKMDVVDAKGNKIGDIEVYTTRIDTVYWMSYAVVAPEHSVAQKIMELNPDENIASYIYEAKNKSELARIAEDRQKTWVFSGFFAINPFTNQKVPLWIADYVLWDYGTGAVMAVPAHDERDFEFAQRYNLPIVPVVAPDETIKDESKYWERIGERAYTQKWVLFNSWEFSWLSSEEAKQKMTQWLQSKWLGKKQINYKLRDWIFSRQRYWGEPIPLIHINLDDYETLPRINSLEQVGDPNIAYVLEVSDELPVKKDDLPYLFALYSDFIVPSIRYGEEIEFLKLKRWEYLVIGSKIFSPIKDWLETKIVADYRLPLELPQVEKYEPAWDWLSPLASIDSFVNVKLADNLQGKRETNTMPQWGGSCWYYLRFMDPKNDEILVNPDVGHRWNAVDSYVWWAEHAVLHLLYARFWHKFLFDIGVVDRDEPFWRLRNQGLILAHAFERKDGWLVAIDQVEERDGRYFDKQSWEEVFKVVAKMSKSLKNVVNPDDIVRQYGADAFRLYEMYMADFKDAAPWDAQGIIGVRRFLDRVWKHFFISPKKASDDQDALRLLHKSVKKIEEDIEQYKFNTAIAQLMILLNEWEPTDDKLKNIWQNWYARLLHPFAPHLAEEIWHYIKWWEMVDREFDTTDEKFKSVYFAPWPKYDPELVKDATVVIGIQVNGKIRWEVQLAVDESRESALQKARQKVAKYLEGKEIIKEIYIPSKIVNIVVK